MRWLLTLSAWLALATGVLELTFLAGDKWLLRKTLFVGQDVVWLAPVGYLLLFLGVGLVVSGLQRRSRRDLAPALVGSSDSSGPSVRSSSAIPASTPWRSS